MVAGNTAGCEVAVIERSVGDKVVRQRADGYWDATGMCKAHGKKWSHYWENDDTRRFVQALGSKAGIPAFELVKTKRGSPAAGGGTWVHRIVAVDLARWCDQEFHVLVILWADEIMRTGRVEVKGHPAVAETGDVRRLADSVAALRADVAGMREAMAEPRPLAVFEPGLMRQPVVGWVTVHDRCAKLGAAFGPADRAKVTQWAVGAAWMCSDHPAKFTERPGAEWYFQGQGVAAVDNAIRRMQDAVAARRKAAGPSLFDDGAA